MRLETARLVLRRWEPRDRAPFAALNADAAVIDPPLDRRVSDELIDTFERLWDADGFAFSAVERREDGAFAGMVGLQRFDGEPPVGDCVEVGWRLPRALWGRGYATEAAGAWIAHGFDELGLTEIVAFTKPGNVRSLAVMRRLGMRRDAARDFVHPELPDEGPLQVFLATPYRRDVTA